MNLILLDTHFAIRRFDIRHWAKFVVLIILLSSVASWLAILLAVGCAIPYYCSLRQQLGVTHPFSPLVNSPNTIVECLEVFHCTSVSAKATHCHPLTRVANILLIPPSTSSLSGRCDTSTQHGCIVLDSTLSWAEWGGGVGWRKQSVKSKTSNRRAGKFDYSWRQCAGFQ